MGPWRRETRPAGPPEMGARRDGGFAQRRLLAADGTEAHAGGAHLGRPGAGGRQHRRRTAHFAKAFIAALRANAAVIDGTQLFSQMRRPAILNTDQTPQYSDVRRAGHEGGDFLFVRRR